MVSREELHTLVWSQPMTKVAETFKVSGSYMARVCTELNVPRPERGYWAKLAVGKAPAMVPLPQAQPGDAVEWSQDGQLRLAPRPARPLHAAPAKRIKRVDATRGTHPLISGARAHFENSRKVDEWGYLKPYKKLLVDLTASRSGLTRALALGNELFNLLESASYHVTLPHPAEQFRRDQLDEHEVPRKKTYYDHNNRLWWPQRPTVVYVGEVAIGLSLVEMSESVLMRYVRGGTYIRDADYVAPRSGRAYQADHTWTTTMDIPSGRFRLVAYAPHYRVSWSTHWQESTQGSLNKMLPGIVTSMQGLTEELAVRLVEADRKAERDRLAWEAAQDRMRRKEDVAQIQKSHTQSHQQLEQILASWAKVKSLERFFEGVEAEIGALPVAEQAHLRERLDLARGFVGSQDPLDFFRAWQTPLERYTPKYEHGEEAAALRDDSEE